MELPGNREDTQDDGQGHDRAIELRMVVNAHPQTQVAQSQVQSTSTPPAIPTASSLPSAQSPPHQQPQVPQPNREEGQNGGRNIVWKELTEKSAKQ